MQLVPTGPDIPEFLQWPSTASSGRKLITVTVGGSYFFMVGLPFVSSMKAIPRISNTRGASPAAYLYTV